MTVIRAFRLGCHGSLETSAKVRVKEAMSTESVPMCLSQQLLSISY